MSVARKISLLNISIALSIAAVVSVNAQAAALTAGSPPSSAPTTFLNTQSGKIEGFMPDVAAEGPGVSIWKSILPPCRSQR